MENNTVVLSTVTRLMVHYVSRHIGAVEFGGDAPPAGSVASGSLHLFQHNVSFELTHADMLLNLDDFEERFIVTSANKLAEILSVCGIKTAFRPPPPEKLSEYIGPEFLRCNGLSMRGLISMSPFNNGKLLARFDVIGTAVSLSQIREAA